MEIKKNKKRSNGLSKGDNEVFKQGLNFIKALKKAELPTYIDVATNPWKIFWFSFLKGTGFGLGTLLGASVIITVIAYVFRLLEKMPFFGEIFRDVARFFGW